VDDNLPDGWRIETTSVLSRDGDNIGILHPATLHEIVGDEISAILGPAGRVALTEGTNYIEALSACGALLLGHREEISKVSTLLQSARMSRTTSYLCSISGNCRQVLTAVRHIQTARVAVVGCGGIGSLAAMLLAGSGIRSLTLVDNDTIEESNLNRQIVWSKDDIGQLKSDVLARELQRRFDDVSLALYPRRADRSFLQLLLSENDAVLLTADSPLGIVPAARRIAARLCSLLVTGGYSFKHAIVTVTNSQSNSAGKEGNWQSLEFCIPPSFGPANALLAGATTSALLHQLCELADYGASSIFGWDVDTLKNSA